MKIIYCKEEDATDWDAFLSSQETASFYHLFAWKKINESSFGHTTYYLAATEGGKFCGVLPLVYINSLLFGKILCSMPFVNLGGVCVSDPRAESMLLAEAKSIVAKEGIGYLEFRNMNKLAESLPTSEHKISMILDLDSDPDVIWAGLKPKQRQEVRRATNKNNLHVVFGGVEMLDLFFFIIAASWRSLGTPIYKKEYFRTILQNFPNNTRIFVVKHGNIPIAAAFNGYYQGTVEGMWLGLLPQYRQMNPNSVLYWEMIKHACENNFKKFHLGRSSVDSGGEFYKRKWNAKPKQLYWQYHLGSLGEIPQLNVNNPKYSLAIKVWRKLPLRLTYWLGPVIARNIP